MGWISTYLVDDANREEIVTSLYAVYLLGGGDLLGASTTGGWCRDCNDLPVPSRPENDVCRTFPPAVNVMRYSRCYGIKETRSRHSNGSDT